MHRSLLFDAVEEQKRGLMTEILEALEASEESNTRKEIDPPKDVDNENKKEAEDDSDIDLNDLDDDPIKKKKASDTETFNAAMAAIKAMQE